MKVSTLREAIAEAERFIAIAKKVNIETVIGRDRMAGKTWERCKNQTKESASCKRASMDLTRVLARLRLGK